MNINVVCVNLLTLKRKKYNIHKKERHEDCLATCENLWDSDCECGAGPGGDVLVPAVSSL